jgi:hypothetical protein
VMKQFTVLKLSESNLAKVGDAAGPSCSRAGYGPA